MEQPEAFSQFKAIIQQRHHYAQEWQARTGGRVLGYFCCYFPEEIAYAAGLLPVRIITSLKPQELGSLHIPTFFCSYCRDCLAEGLEGSYGYLSGIAMAHTCRQIVQAYESWCRHIPLPYHYYLPMPALADNPRLLPWVVQEMAEFQASLEAWTGKRVSPEAMRRAIDIYNDSRRLLGKIYEARKAEPPAISGGLAFEAVLSSMLCDKAEHNTWLEAALAALPAGVEGSRRPRLMVVGGENHDPELIHLIEAQGAWVVADDLCMGSRYFWGLVSEGEDPLAALAARYLNKPSCPIKDFSNLSSHVRHAHLLKLAQDYCVAGAILIYQKFCDPQELDIPFLRQTFEDKGIPTCVLELETTLARGQVQTRVQAFLETLELEAV